MGVKMANEADMGSTDSVTIPACVVMGKVGPCCLFGPW